MAITSFPFDGQDTTEDQYSRLFSDLQDTGVAASADAADLGVTADGSTLTVAVAPGFAYVRGFGFHSTAVESLAIPVPTSGVAVHRVVLRLDPAANSIALAVLEGAADEGAPALTQTEVGVYELSLARVQVSAGAVAIGQSDVFDERTFSGTRVGAWLGASSRPANPRVGEMGFNLTTGIYEHWTGSSWNAVGDLPPAAVQMYAGSDTPAGFLKCDGALYNAVDYPELAEKLGTTFSVVGDAADTFRTPNLVGMFALGASAGHPLGQVGGSEGKTIAEENLPEHDHPIDHDHGKTERDGAHDHGYRYSEDDGGSNGTLRTGRWANGKVRNGDTSGGIVSDGSDHFHNIAPYTGNSGLAGGNVPLDIMPPFVALNFIVKT